VLRIYNIKKIDVRIDEELLARGPKTNNSWGEQETGKTPAKESL
jgi:hypothetical protein